MWNKKKIFFVLTPSMSLIMGRDLLLIVVEDFQLVFVMKYYPLKNTKFQSQYSIVYFYFISSKNKKILI